MKKLNKKTKASSKKVNELSQTHGKEEKFVPTTLDQVWGDDGTGKYKTLDEDVYRNSLHEMTRIDIQTHATTVGLIPVENRQILTDRLLREFRRHRASFQKPQSAGDEVKLSKEVRETLEEGR
jgi:hypothetical protein